MPFIDYFYGGLRATNYSQAPSNNYYCEASQDDADHRNRAMEITEVFWRLEGLATAIGPSFICDNCYRQLVELEESGIRRRPKSERNANRITRRLPK